MAACAAIQSLLAYTWLQYCIRCLVNCVFVSVFVELTELYFRFRLFFVFVTIFVYFAFSFFRFRFEARISENYRACTVVRKKCSSGEY